jgi:hypothetical protein
MATTPFWAPYGKLGSFWEVLYYSDYSEGISYVMQEIKGVAFGISGAGKQFSGGKSDGRSGAI